MLRDKDQKRPLKMSLEQTLEQERKELLRNLDGLKNPKAPRMEGRTSGRSKNLLGKNKQEKTTSSGGFSAATGESGRRASVSSPLASSSPWTNTLLSEWDDSIYEPSDGDEPEPERRASDSVTQLRREKEKMKEREVDIDAGFLYGMQPSIPHIVLPQRHRHSVTGACK